MTAILVVDDEFDVAQAIKAILEDEGHEVETCRDGREALARLEASAADRLPDLVLLDTMMPYMGGLEVLRQLRGRDGDLGSLPVVLMTNTDVRVKKSDYRWDDVLKKPFDWTALVHVVSRYGERAR